MSIKIFCEAPQKKGWNIDVLNEKESKSSKKAKKNNLSSQENGLKKQIKQKKQLTTKRLVYGIFYSLSIAQEKSLKCSVIMNNF